MEIDPEIAKQTMATLILIAKSQHLPSAIRLRAIDEILRRACSLAKENLESNS